MELENFIADGLTSSLWQRLEEKIEEIVEERLGELTFDKHIRLESSQPSGNGGFRRLEFILADGIQPRAGENVIMTEPGISNISSHFVDNVGSAQKTLGIYTHNNWWCPPGHICAAGYSVRMANIENKLTEFGDNCERSCTNLLNAFRSLSESVLNTTIRLGTMLDLLKNLLERTFLNKSGD